MDDWNIEHSTGPSKNIKFPEEKIEKEWFDLTQKEFSLNKETTLHDNRSEKEETLRVPKVNPEGPHQETKSTMSPQVNKSSINKVFSRPSQILKSKAAVEATLNTMLSSDVPAKAPPKRKKLGVCRPSNTNLILQRITAKANLEQMNITEDEKADANSPSNSPPSPVLGMKRKRKKLQ